MIKPTTVKTLEDLGRVRLSAHFFMRDLPRRHGLRRSAGIAALV